MSWDLFFRKLEDLNYNLASTSKKKNDAYKILVEHNKRAELDFITRLTIRKINKMIKNKEIASNYQKETLNKFNYVSNKDSFNIKILRDSESEYGDSQKIKEYSKYNELTYKVNVEVGAPSMGVPTSFLCGLHI